jgi:hypothetical protein
MSKPNYPRGNEAWSLAVMQAQGRSAEALLLLEALNRVQRAFDKPAYDMPPPATTNLPDLVRCPA